MKNLLKVLVTLSSMTWVSETTWAECPELRILEALPLAFGHIAVAEGQGGVVVVSASSAVATLGGVGSGAGAEPGLIRICGPAEAKFTLSFDTTELDIANGSRTHSPHVIRNLEIIARGTQIHPSGATEWTGKLGRRGEAEIFVGGTLVIPPNQTPSSFSAPFRIAVVPAD
jgi:hypothetical protein